MRCAVLLNYIRGRDGAAAVDPVGTGRVCETCPDPALRAWTDGDPRSLMPRESYRGADRAARREDLINLISERAGLSDPAGLLALCAAHDHCLDALICALVAGAAWLGLTAVPPALPGAAHSEGWIHVPTCPLQALIEPPAALASTSDAMAPRISAEPALPAGRTERARVPSFVGPAHGPVVQRSQVWPHA